MSESKIDDRPVDTEDLKMKYGTPTEYLYPVTDGVVTRVRMYSKPVDDRWMLITTIDDLGEVVNQYEIMRGEPRILGNAALSTTVENVNP